jgi:hypothetical protein
MRSRPGDRGTLDARYTTTHPLKKSMAMKWECGWTKENGTVCEKVFPTRDDLRHHRDDVHKVHPECSACDYNSHDKSKVKYRMKICPHIDPKMSEGEINECLGITPKNGL